MRPKTLLGLIVCNLVWSAHSAMGKVLLASFSAPLSAWLRYASALAGYLLAVLLWRATRRRDASTGVFLIPRDAGTAVSVAMLGVLAFCLSPLLWITGLSGSRALDGALIVALEPIAAVLLAAVFLRERVAPRTLAALVLALSGFFLFSDFPRLAANLLILGSVCVDAAYSVLARRLVARHAPISVFGTSLALGLLALTLSPAVTRELVNAAMGPAETGPVSWSALGAVLWIGPLGSAFAFLYWLIALAEAPVASVALTLFVQPVFGSLWGWLFFGDRLTLFQVLGAVLILVALLMAISVTRRAKK